MDKQGLTIQQASDAVEAIFRVITRYIRNGQNAKLRGFGTFCVLRMKARRRRDNIKHRYVEVPAHDYVVFRVGRKLKGQMNVIYREQLGWQRSTISTGFVD